MYNQSTKEEFLRDSELTGSVSKDLASEVFSVSSNLEEGIGADLNAMGPADLMQVSSVILDRVSKTSWPDENGMRNEVIKILRAYGSWSLKKQISNCTSELVSLEDPSAVNYRIRFSANPIHLRQQLEDLFPLEEDYGTINDTFHCFFWMAFAGIDEATAVQLTSKHADFRRMCFCINGKTYPIYTEGFPSIWNAIHCERFRVIHPNYTKISVRDRAGGDLILRGFTQKISTSRIGSDMRITQAKFKADITTPNLSYRNVRYSGAFYRAYMQEMAGMRIDFTEIAKNSVSKQRDSSGELDRRNLWNKTREIKVAYQNWKHAFVYK